MFPGLTTKLSEGTVAAAAIIYPQSDLVHITDTTSTTVLTTIAPTFGGGFSGMLILVNRSGASMTTVTTGNIATAITIGQNVATLLVYSKSQAKWYMGALA